MLVCPWFFLEVLKAWNYTLAKDDFRALMDRASSYVRLEALRYADRVHAREYASVIAAYLEDSDPNVAATAKNVVKKLNGQ